MEVDVCLYFWCNTFCIANKISILNAKISFLNNCFKSFESKINAFVSLGNINLNTCINAYPSFLTVIPPFGQAVRWFAPSSIYLGFGTSYELDICVYLQRAQCFALQTKIMILRPTRLKMKNPNNMHSN